MKKSPLGAAVASMLNAQNNLQKLAVLSRACVVLSPEHAHAVAEHTKRQQAQVSQAAGVLRLHGAANDRAF